MKKLGIILLFILFAIPLPFAGIYSLFALMRIATEIIEMNFGMVVVFLMIALEATIIHPPNMSIKHYALFLLKFLFIFDTLLIVR